MAIQESGEMYLETILILKRKNPAVRSIDICHYMNYSKPSVSRAMGLLKKDGYITVDTEGYISLTEQGESIATKIYERHAIITEFFMRLGVCEETASLDACKIEHDISNESFEAIKKFIGK